MLIKFPMDDDTLFKYLCFASYLIVQCCLRGPYLVKQGIKQCQLHVVGLHAIHTQILISTHFKVYVAHNLLSNEAGHMD